MNGVKTKTVLASAVAALLCGTAGATEPCGDFGECKVLVEINSSDGDIGFHFLMDGDNLRYGALFNPKHRKIYSYGARRELAHQFVTETFNESAEPLCWHPEPEDDEYGEPVVTLEEFIDRWMDGTYHFFAIGEGWETSYGQSELSFNLPAAPADVEWEEEEDGDDTEGEITWLAGSDLGECADEDDIAELIAEGVLPMNPANVPVAAWEVVLEPDVEDGDPLNGMNYVVRIPGDAEELEVEVPDDYLETLPDNTPAKVEVGAIGFDDNATFTEEGDICLNEDDPDEFDDFDGCGFEIEEDD
ncbi:MAG: hypothetical protein GTO71_08355 [Woeseiaceae bacterium]|nr:hypothetical protein [Woeseiaceae bacterium]NIP21096.1 hypothetical protein [Woeseiaceae bacterium]NIS90068.1 hypothetical protein [Woeseiaceae bacterium]